jgi:hypothetical protein
VAYTMRVLIKSKRKEEGDGWIIFYLDPDTGAALAPNRSLTNCDAPRQHLPLPPSPAPPQPKDGAEGEVYKLCTNRAGNEIQTALENVSRAESFAGDVRRFGRYLFEVLIGDNWSKLAAPAVTVELELMFENKDRHIASLPWEMMWNNQGPLGAQNDRRVAITRIVQVASGNAVPRLDSVRLPLRVLFIVGRWIDNDLQPGAELIGICSIFDRSHLGPNRKCCERIPTDRRSYR